MNALHAFAFGFSLALAIGPIALLIVQNGINHGLQVAVRSALGAASADWTYALLAFSVGSEIIRALSPRAPVIRTMSAFLLIAIGAWLAWKAVHSHTADSAPTERARATAAGFWITLGLTLSNPLTLAIFLAFAGQLSPGGDNYSAALYSLCVFLGSLAVQLVLALLGASIGKWLANARVIAMLTFASGISIVAFGVRGLLVAS
jgi:threonine/homoserine/homoserine lactone efflux protein